MDVISCITHPRAIRLSSGVSVHMHSMLAICMRQRERAYPRLAKRVLNLPNRRSATTARGNGVREEKTR